ncbi:MAG TPA: ATP-binding protein [Usitatibacter sp.]|nr:ATP-binding protein [Usitatibacter sp.]
MSGHKEFARGNESLESIFEFTSEFFVRNRLDPRILPIVDFAVEELFTNMVKYGGADASPIAIEIACVDGAVEVALVDTGVEPFDMTQAPDVEVHGPIEERKAGGLGLHLVRRLVDSWDYRYSKELRQSRITFRKAFAKSQARAAASAEGGSNAVD